MNKYFTISNKKYSAYFKQYTALFLQQDTVVGLRQMLSTNTSSGNPYGKQASLSQYWLLSIFAFVILLPYYYLPGLHFTWCLCIPLRKVSGRVGIYTCRVAVQIQRQSTSKTLARSIFILLRPSTDQMSPVHIMEANCFTQSPLI